MTVGVGNRLTAVVLGLGVLLAGSWPSPSPAGEPGPWAAAPLSEAELADHAGREGVLVIGDDHVVGSGKSSGTIDNTTIGDIGSTGNIGNVKIRGGSGFVTIMTNTGANANMVNNSTVTVRITTGPEAP